MKFKHAKHTSSHRQFVSFLTIFDLHFVSKNIISHMTMNEFVCSRTLNAKKAATIISNAHQISTSNSAMLMWPQFPLVAVG